MKSLLFRCNRINFILFQIQYMMDQDLAGFFVWAIDLDDFDGGFCNEGVYPLFNHILEVMEGDAW